MVHYLRTQNLRIEGLGWQAHVDEWRVQMLNKTKREAYLVKEADLNILFKDVNNNITQQKEDIRQLVKNGIDVLVISPLQSKPLKTLIDSVAGLNIPTILIDRHIQSKQSLYYIGANNFKIGVSAGKEAMRLLPEGGNIVCFKGR